MCVVVSMGTPHTGQAEWDCSFHLLRFLEVAQNSAFHLMVSACFNVGREVKATDKQSHATCLLDVSLMSRLVSQYERVGDLVSSK